MVLVVPNISCLVGIWNWYWKSTAIPLGIEPTAARRLTIPSPPTRYHVESFPPPSIALDLSPRPHPVQSHLFVALSHLDPIQSQGRGVAGGARSSCRCRGGALRACRVGPRISSTGLGRKSSSPHAGLLVGAVA